MLRFSFAKKNIRPLLRSSLTKKVTLALRLCACKRAHCACAGYQLFSGICAIMPVQIRRVIPHRDHDPIRINRAGFFIASLPKKVSPAVRITLSRHCQLFQVGHLPLPSLSQWASRWQKVLRRHRSLPRKSIAAHSKNGRPFCAPFPFACLSLFHGCVPESHIIPFKTPLKAQFQWCFFSSSVVRGS